MSKIRRKVLEGMPFDMDTIVSQLSYRAHVEDVVYEFLQNSLDANPTMVSIRAFEDAQGRSYLEIADDGEGMFSGEGPLTDENNDAIGDSRDIRFFVTPGVTWKKYVPDTLGKFGTGGKSVWKGAVTREGGICVYSRADGVRLNGDTADMQSVELRMDYLTHLLKPTIALEEDGIPRRKSQGTTVTLENLTRAFVTGLKKLGASRLARHFARECTYKIVENNVKVSLDVFGDKIAAIEPFEYVRQGRPVIDEKFEDEQYGRVHVEFYIDASVSVQGVCLNVRSHMPVVNLHKEYEDVFGEVWGSEYVAGIIACDRLPAHESRMGLKEDDEVISFLERLRDKYQLRLEQAVEKYEKKYEAEYHRSMLDQLAKDVLHELPDDILDKLPFSLTGRRTSQVGKARKGTARIGNRPPHLPRGPIDGQEKKGDKSEEEMRKRQFRINPAKLDLGGRPFKFRDGVVNIDATHEICDNCRKGKNYRKLWELYKRLAVECLFEYVHKIPAEATDAKLMTEYRLGMLGAKK